jgi:hypothetical protein
MDTLIVQFFSGLAKFGIPTILTVMACQKTKNLILPTWLWSIIFSVVFGTASAALSGVFEKPPSVIFGALSEMWGGTYLMATLFYEAIWKRLSKVNTDV